MTLFILYAVDKGILYVYTLYPHTMPPTYPPIPQELRTVIKSEDIEGVIREALNRYKTGSFDHGELDLSTDKRDFINEAEQELLDCINYCVFQILRLRTEK